MGTPTEGRADALKADEVFETFSGCVLAFVGQLGAGGVLVYREDVGWVFYPAGSLTWDGLHQEVYRNFRADQIDQAELHNRGLPAPPFEEYRGRPAIQWQDNFEREIPLRSVPQSVQARLGRGWTSAYVVLSEDRYETSLGDGKYLYPEAAFWTLKEANAYLQARAAEAANPDRAPDPAKARWYSYTIRPIRLRANRAEKTLQADAPSQSYEHIILAEVANLLATERG